MSENISGEFLKSLRKEKKNVSKEASRISGNFAKCFSQV